VKTPASKFLPTYEFSHSQVMNLDFAISAARPLFLQ
jgi:hypothetical protein